MAIVSLASGAVAAVAFPFLMTRRRDPLVPPRLFRSRNFTVTNISTFVIYGALYVALTFLGIFLIGTLGYTSRPPASPWSRARCSWCCSPRASGSSQHGPGHGCS
jgi:hypothetical protein